MFRFLNIAACALLIGSAVYAYTIKYETLFHAEQIAKMTRQIKTERAAIGMQRAEFSHLTRTERLQPLADKYLTLQQLAPSQIVSLASLPDRTPAGDGIGRKLESLGLSEPTSTPASPKSRAPATPSNGAR